MKTLRQQHKELDSKINSRYNELLDKVESITFYEQETDEFDECLDDCEVITYIDRRGDDNDAKVLKISKSDGIYVAKDEDDSQRFWIGLNDLSSLYDKISIVELLENNL